MVHQSDGAAPVTSRTEDLGSLAIPKSLCSWTELLNTRDVNQLWRELYRIVSEHPLVGEGEKNAFRDLTEELFVRLLVERRFEHYLATSMTDLEIEKEISQTELTNILTAESYSPAQSISTPDRLSTIKIVEGFLKDLHDCVNGKEKQYNRILKVLWECYLTPEHLTQLEVAAKLEVSDSLVSDYRKRIDRLTEKMVFATKEEARIFEDILKERVEELLVSAVVLEIAAMSKRKP
jgi:hypothetical protein